MALTEESIETTQALIRWMHATVAVNGGALTKLLAHRQSSATRRSDPGEAIWKRIARPMIAELGLDDGGPGFAIDGGRPIPEEWNAARKGVRY